MKTRRKQPSRTKKQQYMSNELFGELMQSLDDALRHSRGEKLNVRTTTLPAATDG